MLRLPISEKDMEKEHSRQLAKRRQAKEKSPARKKKTHKSSSQDETWQEWQIVDIFSYCDTVYLRVWVVRRTNHLMGSETIFVDHWEKKL